MFIQDLRQLIDLQTRNPKPNEVKKGKTKGIFDIRQETDIKKLLFKQSDKEIKQILDK